MRSNGMNALERRAAGAAFATLGLVLAAHSILETARDALFLRSLPATQLPWVYLIIAVLALAITAFESALARGLKRLDLLSYFLFAAAVLTAALWAAADFVSLASIWALYVWTGVFGTLATIHFWLSIGAAFTVTQAKRIFGLVGAGALGGAIVGSTLARVMVAFTPTRELVLLAAGCILLAGFAAHFGLRSALRSLGGAEGGANEPVRVRDAMHSMRAEPYVRRVVLFVLLATVAITLADFLFKREVAADIPPEGLGPFFATFYASLNVVALVVQLVVVGWMLDRVGVPRTLSILPALLFGGGLWAALSGGLPAVLFLRATNGSLKHSLHQTATEVLFVPLPGRERNRAKTVADVVGHRGGQALASIAILLGVWLFDGGRWVAWGIALTAAMTTALALKSRRAYLDVFRRKLGAGSRDGGRRLPPLDRHALEVLFGALDSSREREVVASLDVFHEQGRIDLVPALILHHPSPRVVERALRWFVAASRRNFVSTALRVDTEDPALRAALLRAIAAVGTDPDVLRDALEDPSRRVRATAVVELTALGAMSAAEARRRLSELLGFPAARRAIAAALAVRPCPALTDLLPELAVDDDFAVRAEAVNAIAAAADPRFWPVLLASLRERALRPLARRGFARGGDAGLRVLAAALHDDSLPLDVRLHVPRSIASFEAERAAPLLWSRLLGEPDAAVRYKILRALGALAARGGPLQLDDEEVGDSDRRRAGALPSPGSLARGDRAGGRAGHRHRSSAPRSPAGGAGPRARARLPHPRVAPAERGLPLHSARARERRSRAPRELRGAALRGGAPGRPARAARADAAGSGGGGSRASAARRRRDAGRDDRRGERRRGGHRGFVRERDWRGGARAANRPARSRDRSRLDAGGPGASPGAAGSALRRGGQWLRRRACPSGCWR